MSRVTERADKIDLQTEQYALQLANKSPVARFFCFTYCLLLICPCPLFLCISQLKLLFRSFIFLVNSGALLFQSTSCVLLFVTHRRTHTFLPSYRVPSIFPKFSTTHLFFLLSRIKSLECFHFLLSHTNMRPMENFYFLFLLQHFQFQTIFNFSLEICLFYFKHFCYTFLNHLLLSI